MISHNEVILFIVNLLNLDMTSYVYGVVEKLTFMIVFASVNFYRNKILRKN